MKTNIGTLDRIIRVVVGLALLGAGLAFKSWWGLLGLPLLGTAAFGWCGLYTLLGISTCAGKAEPGAGASSR